MTVISLIRKTAAVFLAASLSAAMLSGRNIKFDKEILYKASNDAYSSEMCRLDVGYEEGGEMRPVIVWFHGGGLTAGHREVPSALLEDGAVVVGVGYRFVSHVKLKEVLEDAAEAVSWVMKNAPAYGGDTTKVYLAGHSAGGYIVDMLALDKQYLGKYGINPDRMAAIVPYSGQVITHFAQRKKNGIGELTPAIDEYAPLGLVRGDAAPFLVISADREMELFGRYEETAYFVRMLKLNGHKDVTFYELEGFNHGDMAQPGHLILLKYIREHNRKY
ncbi:MAG: alpha/beta hydrolase [Candidatus Cryptobacteroides sp.]